MTPVHGPLLSAEHVTSDQRGFAAVIAVVSTAFFAAAVPFATVQLAPVPAFIPIYQTALVVNDLITAALLFSQLRYRRSSALATLACGYLFTALLAMAHGLTFPGLFAPTGGLGAGPQSTAWLYMFWHGGFPLFVFAYAVMNVTTPGRAAIVSAALATVAAAVTLAWIATAGHAYLPAIMVGNRYTPLMTAVVAGTWLLSAIALVALWRRRPSTPLDLCLMVVMVTWVYDIALSAVLNAGRFDLGFYAGRIYGLLGASLVLIALLLENGNLFLRLRERTLESEQARQAALDAERAKGAFLATMSHEIRTPMNGVIGMLELLSLSRLDPDQSATLKVARESAQSLVRIIDDILDFSKIEAGKLEVRPEPADLKDVIDQVCDVHSGNASRKGLALDRFVSPELARPVVVDSLRLRQILGNLVSNAIKFTDAGRIGLRAEVAGERGDLQVVRFAVSDTGAGIPADEAARLFQPFSQVAGTHAGTGLGLSISRRLAELMGGELAMQTLPGAGTTMVLTIPLPLAKAGLPKPRLADSPHEGAVAPTGLAVGRNKATVLVADDHPVNRMILARQLEALGYAAKAGGDGSEALRIWSGGGIDAVITDCQMPGMDGYELSRRIRAQEGAAGMRVPIIAYTANAMPGEVERCRASGMDDHLAKPVTMSQLKRKLEHWLAEPAPIDLATLGDLAAGDRAMEDEVLRQFRASLAGDSRELQRAMLAQDAASIATQAHRTKGASRTLGARRLADACERLEQAARDEDWGAIAANLEGLQGAIAEMLDWSSSRVA